MSNEITTYKPSAMALALTSQKVIDLPDNVAKSRLMDIVSKTEFELGYKASDAKYKAVSTVVHEEEGGTDKS